MAVDPRDRIDIKPEEVVDESDQFYEPRLVIERTMSNSQMQHIGEINAGNKPEKEKITGTREQPGPRSEIDRRHRRARRPYPERPAAIDFLAGLLSGTRPRCCALPRARACVSAGL